MKQRVAQLLAVTPEQLQRAWPFFGVYLLLFAAMTIADAVALSLFASRAGAAALPKYYALTAVCSLGLISVYLLYANRVDGGRVFGVILAGMVSAWSVAWLGQWSFPGPWPLGLLFVSREIAQTMVLMHFGTYLQDYFFRRELNRVLPLIYAGGRVGGMVAGGAVSLLAQPLGTANLLPLAVTLAVLAWGAIRWIARHRPVCGQEPEDPEAVSFASSVPADSGEPQAVTARVGGFLRHVVRQPLLRWMTVTTLCFVACRWWLVYQYTAAFETGFANEDALTQYLGWYTQVALGLSLILQLFVVVRLVMWQGVPRTHGLYSWLVWGGLIGNVLFTGVPMATLSRFVESELRFGLRNPVNQMLVNRFDKRTRIAVRGWSMGWLIPIGTLVVSLIISLLVGSGRSDWIPAGGVVVGLAYVLSAWRIGPAYQSYDKSVRHPAPADRP